MLDGYTMGRPREDCRSQMLPVWLGRTAAASSSGWRTPLGDQSIRGDGKVFSLRCLNDARLEPAFAPWLDDIMFEVQTDHEDRLIFVRMSGVLAVDEALSCAAAKEAAVESLGPPYDHSTLLDIRDLRLQPQEVFAIFTNFVITTKHKSRKIAILAGEGSGRMQFRRVAERAPLRRDMRFFASVDEARVWLGCRSALAA